MKPRISTELLLSVYDDIHLGFLSLDENGNILDINNTMLEILHYTHENVIGKWFGDFITAEYCDSFLNDFNQKNSSEFYSGVILSG